MNTKTDSPEKKRLKLSSNITIEILPPEMLKKVLSYLNPKSLKICLQTCAFWRKMILNSQSLKESKSLPLFLEKKEKLSNFYSYHFSGMDQTTLLLMGMGIAQVFGFRDESFLKPFQKFEYGKYKEISCTFCIKVVDESSIMACQRETFYSKTMLCYLFTNKKWSFHSSFKTEFHGSTCMIPMPNGIYIFKGKEQNAYFLPRGSYIWKKGPELPKPYEEFWTSIESGHKISEEEFVLLGYDESSNPNDMRIYRYHIMKKLWIFVAFSQLTFTFGMLSTLGNSCPTSCHFWNGKFIICGQKDGVRMTEFINLSTGESKLCGGLRIPRYNKFKLAVAHVNRKSRLIAFGGHQHRNQDIRSDVITEVEVWNDHTLNWEISNLRLKPFSKIFLEPFSIPSIMLCP